MENSATDPQQCASSAGSHLPATLASVSRRPACPYISSLIRNCHRVNTISAGQFPIGLFFVSLLQNAYNLLFCKSRLFISTSQVSNVSNFDLCPVFGGFTHQLRHGSTQDACRISPTEPRSIGGSLY